MSLEQSPLTEVKKDSLADLFAKDPLELTQADVTEICKELRSRRESWMKDEASAKQKKPKAKLAAGELDDLLNNLI